MRKKLLDIKELRFKDTSFANLMTKRIYNVLLIATRYDAFTLEEDGRIDEQVFYEYTSLNLRYPPRFTLMTFDGGIMEELHENHYDLVIQMPNLDDTKTMSLAKDIKQEFPNIPFVILTSFPGEVKCRLTQEGVFQYVDYIFSWLGNSELLIAIIKLIEDEMNVEHDTESVGVQVILLVEDSVRFYSSALASLYRIVLKESREFSLEALNEHERMLRMRGRPKILLAQSYEEAVNIVSTYKENILGVITDMSYAHDGEKDKLAGYHLSKWIKYDIDKHIPIIFTSSETANKRYADELGFEFIDKNSKSFPRDLKKTIVANFGFGDFIILNPETGVEIQRIKNLKGLQEAIYEIPTDSLMYHMSNNHFSRFFYSRAIFPVAEWLKKIDITDIEDDKKARDIIHDMIIKYRKMKNLGVVAVFEKERFDEYSNFVRIGNGSLGGKARSIAFMDNIVKEQISLSKYEDAPVLIPKTLVLCTDIFDEFMDINDLYPIALSDLSDDEIFNAFINATFPERLTEDLIAFFNVIKRPIAIRSSSLLEDSLFQPFAGVYSTYMSGYLDDKEKMLHQVVNAIKGVYASAFYNESKTYMMATQNIIDQEKMAIILQEMVGDQHDNVFYPTFSGVARSLNFYPLGNEKSEEGIANVVLGLGKHIVEGGVSLRFSPYHPNNIMQLSNVEFALRDTQRFFYALDLSNTDKKITKDDGFNILKLSTKEAEKNPAFRFISSTYLPQEQMIFDGFYEGGRKIVSFANVLQHKVYPLAGILKTILKVGEHEMGRPVEIEFASELDENGVGNFYLLQMRPIAQNKELAETEFASIDKKDTILYSEEALGHGVNDTIYDIVYVKTSNFNPMNNVSMAEEVSEINQRFLKDNKYYILIGPGRWGSNDQWLGIPVKWAQISNAKILVELGLQGYQIEPSQGTHFFQNLTSLGVGYFPISLSNADPEKNIFNEEYLNGLPAISESEHIRHIQFQEPVIAKINGKKRIGAVMKPSNK